MARWGGSRSHSRMPEKMFAEPLPLEVSAILNSQLHMELIISLPPPQDSVPGGGVFLGVPSFLKPETLISSVCLPFPHTPRYPKSESTSSLDLTASQLSPSTCFCLVPTYSLEQCSASFAYFLPPGLLNADGHSTPCF